MVSLLPIIHPPNLEMKLEGIWQRVTPGPGRDDGSGVVVGQSAAAATRTLSHGGDHVLEAVELYCRLVVNVVVVIVVIVVVVLVLAVVVAVGHIYDELKH